MPDILLDTGLERPDALNLERTKDGGFAHSDPRGRFDATIAPDGHVTFEVPDAPIDMRVCVLGICIGDPPDDPRSRRLREAHEQPPSPSERAIANADIPGIGPMAAGMTVRLGPIKVSEGAKSEFLRRTFDLRARMATGWTRSHVRRELHRLDHRLLTIWSDESLPLARRKELLFRRWDECVTGIGPRAANEADDVAGVIDDTRREAGATARGRIEAFIRRHAPQSSPRAFTPAELERFNRVRTSPQLFAPYSVRTPVRPPAAADE